ncbi:hypothetical protein J1605_005858 [Eschrichtius robustus]|uniref:Uncharacterized protein n=1 Tax=Eschrichtius robustus TaxID=9764 RepID=A0AB34H773_ESCRO|nr:hypothetical protein J1605_005858 [Eschrichtius robustus]
MGGGERGGGARAAASWARNWPTCWCWVPGRPRWDLGPDLAACAGALPAAQPTGQRGGLFLRSDPSIRAVMLAGVVWARAGLTATSAKAGGHRAAGIAPPGAAASCAGTTTAARWAAAWASAATGPACVCCFTPQASCCTSVCGRALTRQPCCEPTHPCTPPPPSSRCPGAGRSQAVSPAQFALALVTDTCVACAPLCAAGPLFRGMLLLRGQTTWEWARGRHSYDPGPSCNLQAAPGPRWVLVWLWPFPASPWPGGRHQLPDHS